MGFSKHLEYANPLNWTQFVYDNLNPKNSVKATQTITKPHICTMNMSRMVGRNFIKLAGISGAIAVAMGAYGSHGLFPKQDVPAERKEVYKTANLYHFIHTLALIGVPFTRRPVLVGSLMSTGILLFCGTCYYYALTGNTNLIPITPYGGSLLIVAWLTMLL